MFFYQYFVWPVWLYYSTEHKRSPNNIGPQLLSLYGAQNSNFSSIPQKKASHAGLEWYESPHKIEIFKPAVPLISGKELHYP